MKIAHLLGWYFPDSVGGTEIYVEALSRRLREAGHEVLVAAPNPRATVPQQYEHAGVAVFRYPIPSQITRDEARHRVPVRGTERLHAWLAHERPDVLHLHSVTTGIGLPEIEEARRLGIRVFLTCHLPGTAYMCRSGELMQWGRRPCDGVVEPPKCAECMLTTAGVPRPIAATLGLLPVAMSRALDQVPGRVGTALGMTASVSDYTGLQRELFDRVERFIVLNETTRRMLASNGSPAEKVVLNRLGVSHASARLKAGPDVEPTRRPVRLGYVGRLHPTKGLNELVLAAMRVSRDVDFRLEIRGPAPDGLAGDFAGDLRRRADADPRIQFDAPLAPDDVPAALARLDALVVPSIWFENGPTVALEAMAAGTPTIASRIGNLAEIVDDGVSGRLVAPGDVTRLSEAIEEAARVPEQTIDIWRRGLRRPRTMDDVARDYLALYAA